MKATPSSEETSCRRQEDGIDEIGKRDRKDEQDERSKRHPEQRVSADTENGTEQGDDEFPMCERTNSALNSPTICIAMASAMSAWPVQTRPADAADQCLAARPEQPSRDRQADCHRRDHQAEPTGDFSGGGAHG